MPKRLDHEETADGGAQDGADRVVGEDLADRAADRLPVPRHRLAGDAETPRP